MITKDDNIVIVGASRNPEKYGHKVAEDLISKGYKVFLVNPKGETILERTVFKKISDIDANIDAAIFVTQPSVTEKVLKEVYEKDIRKVWMQPGSESQKAIEYCKEKNIECDHDVCIMMK